MASRELRGDGSLSGVTATIAIAAALLGMSTLKPADQALMLVLILVPVVELHDGRKAIVALSRVLATAALFAGLIGLGRTVGGGLLAMDLVNDYVRLLILLATVGVVVTIMALGWRAGEVLAWADFLRVPRSLSYVVLATGLVGAWMRSRGSRQVALLRLKDPSPSLMDRAQDYYRIVGPLFGLVLREQLIQVRSLEQRRFFVALEAPARPSVRISKRDVLHAALLGVAYLWLRLR